MDMCKEGINLNNITDRVPTFRKAKSSEWLSYLDLLLFFV